MYLEPLSPPAHVQSGKTCRAYEFLEERKPHRTLGKPCMGAKLERGLDVITCAVEKAEGYGNEYHKASPSWSRGRAESGLDPFQRLCKGLMQNLMLT